MLLPLHNYFYLVPLTLSAIFCLKAFRQKWPKPYRLYAYLIFVTLFIELFSAAWSIKLYSFFDASQSNLWIYNLFIIIRFGLLSAIFSLILNQKKVPLVATGIIIIGILDYTLLHGPDKFNTYSMIITHGCIIILCVLYFLQLLQDKTTIIIHKEPLVWMALSSFVYHVVSFPFLIMLGFLNKNNEQLALMFIPINEILNILLCSCYLISFLWKPQYSQPH